MSSSLLDALGCSQELDICEPHDVFSLILPDI